MGQGAAHRKFLLEVPLCRQRNPRLRNASVYRGIGLEGLLPTAGLWQNAHDLGFCLELFFHCR